MEIRVNYVHVLSCHAVHHKKLVEYTLEDAPFIKIMNLRTRQDAYDDDFEAW